MHRPLALVSGLALALAPALPALAAHDVTPARISGADRFETAAEIAVQQYPDGAAHALIARADDFPDALAAAPYAAERGAPILLTRSDEFPDTSADALADLGVSSVTLLGGTAAISAEVEAEIAQGSRVETERIHGAHRYETAAAIARDVQARNGNAENWPGGQRAVFLASGADYADALAAGAPAAARPAAPVPILLSERDTPTQATVDVIEDLDIELVVAVGGTAAISDAALGVLDDDDTTVTRVHGPDRTATAAALADFAVEYLDMDPSRVALARGDDFPDALAAGPYAGSLGDPILLTVDPQTVGAPTEQWLADRCEQMSAIRAIGGDRAVTPTALGTAIDVAEDCHGTESQQTYLVTPQERITLAPGDEFTFEAAATYGGERSLDHPLDVWLFPCAAIDKVEGDTAYYVFHDDNDDGRADGIGSSDTGAAAITALNGTAVAPSTGFRDVAPNDDGRIAVTVSADAADCTHIVFFDDADNSSALEVDDAGDPVEDWGHGVAEWTS